MSGLRLFLYYVERIVVNGAYALIGFILVFVFIIRPIADALMFGPDTCANTGVYSC